MARFGFWMIAAGVVALDQWTKLLVRMNMDLHGPSIPVIPGVVSLTHVHNPGVAFGQLAGAGPLLILAAAGAAVMIVLYRSRLLHREGPLHPLLTVGLALPLGGALGNMIDRIVLGKVVDFIDFGWWPVFNVADTAITLGAVALMTYFLFVNRPEPESGVDAAHPASEYGGPGA